MKKSIIISGSNSELAKGVANKLKKKYDLIFLNHSKQNKTKKKFENIIKIKHSLEDNIDDLYKKIKNKSKNVHGIIHFNGIHNFKTLKSINKNDFNTIFEINCLTFVKLVKLSYHLDKIQSILSISSVSSKTGNKGISLYSSSKAALNMAVKCLSVELEQQGLIAVLFHPGHVQTDMGGQAAPVTPQKSIEGMKNQIVALTHDDNGRFLSYDGRQIPW